jgi:hypothetical protein
VANAVERKPSGVFKYQRLVFTIFKGNAAHKLFCTSRVNRTTNNGRPTIELVSRRIRASPHVTLPRAGSLTPGLV